MLTLAFTACGETVTVATSDELRDYSDQKPIMLAWQGMMEAAQAEDCEGALEYIRVTVQADSTACPAIYTYFEDTPTIDWSRTQWSGTGDKAKIYEKDGGSITSFIHNTADDTWKADEKFWE